ncbi:MAG: prepilin peptidase [Lachnospiraceae bacterium]|nr:prepilin peptidase [Lachnospiraceae bacterium]
MIDRLENPWILAGKVVSSLVLGSFLGLLFAHRAFRNACEEAEKASRKAIGCAMMTGCFFTLTVLLRGNIGASVLRDWALFVILLSVSFRDIKSYQIPRKALLSGIFLWSLWLIVGGLSGEVSAWSAFADGVLSAGVFSWLLLILTLVAERLIRKETLGGGDIKLIFMVMLHLGFLRGFLCLVLSVLSGLVFLIFRRQKRFPFAPSIAAGAIVSMLVDCILRNAALLSASY